MEKERITEQFSKTLDTPFTITNIVFETIDKFYCPVSVINYLRRDLLTVLEVNTVNSFKKSYGTDYVEDSEYFGEQETEPGSIKNMYTYPVLRLNEDILEEGADIYAFSIYDLSDPDIYSNAIDFVKDQGALLVLLIPDFHHDKINKIIDYVISLLKVDMGDAFIAVMASKLFTDRKFLKDGLEFYASAGTNIYSAKSLSHAFKYADAVMPSYEVSADDLMLNLRHLTESYDLEGKHPKIIVHSEGLIPWMQSDFCAAGRNQRPCSFCRGNAYYELKPKRDSDGTDLKVIPHPLDCSCSIYGRAKNPIDQDYAEAISNLGFDVICNYTILPGGKIND